MSRSGRTTTTTRQGLVRGENPLNPRLRVCHHKYTLACLLARSRSLLSPPSSLSPLPAFLFLSLVCSLARSLALFLSSSLALTKGAHFALIGAAEQSTHLDFFTSMTGCCDSRDLKFQQRASRVPTTISRNTAQSHMHAFPHCFETMLASDILGIHQRS